MSLSRSRLQLFNEMLHLVHSLAKWVSPAMREGVPEALQESYAGLSAHVEVFRAGEVARAEAWLKNWLSNNVVGYVKICDPYFGFAQLEYFRYLPEECKVLIVTSDEYIRREQYSNTQQRVEAEWKRIASGSMPRTQFLIVPRELSERFHDRVLITQRSGLDIGPSLSGLGKSLGKVRILSEDEASEIEQGYLERMLSQATWFMEHGIYPEVFFVGSSSRA